MRDFMENENREKRWRTIEEEIAEASLSMREEERREEDAALFDTASGEAESDAGTGAKAESDGGTDAKAEVLQDIKRERAIPRSRRGKPSRKGIRLLIGIGILAGAAGIAYGIGAFRYRNTYFPNTIINGIEAGGLTAQEVKDLLASAIDGYAVRLVGREDAEETIAGTDIGLHTVYDGQLEQMIQDQNPLLWGLALFGDRTTEIDTVVAYDENAFEAALDGLSFLDEDTVRVYREAYLSDYIEGQGYEIIPEDPGTEVDREALSEALSHAVLSLQQELSLETAGCYVHPAGQEPAQALVDARDEMNRYVGTVVTYTFGSSREVLDGSTIHTWVSLNESGQPLLDETMVSEYVSDLAKKYNTAYTKRKFMTSYGREVEVSGVYGWRINQTAETAALTEIIRSGESQTREPEYSQKAASHDGNDYGNTYAEVNLTAQHLFFYKDGEKILESDFVSGNVSRGYTTPPGLFSLTYKQKDAVLRGEGYASPVDFWMPFNGGIGFHDASWRNQFGGTIYKTNGSHGCINMPYNAAKTLYENVYAGMPVICYNLEGTENTKSTSASGSAAAETQPTTAAAETQPTTAAAETQPTTAAAETQPTTAAAETQPTTAAAETQPTTAAAETQPTTAAAETQPQTPPGPGGETEYGPGMDLTGPGISYGPGGQNASGPGSTTGS